MGAVIGAACAALPAAARAHESVDIVEMVSTLDTLASTQPSQTPPSQDTRPVAPAARVGVLCEKRDCGIERDWLTRRTSAAAGWAVGGVAAVLVLALGVEACIWRNGVFADGTLALALLAASIFLRGAIGAQTGNTDAEYKAAMALAYIAGIELAYVLGVLAIRLHLHFHPLALTKRAVAEAVARLAAVGLAALVVVGSVLMFDTRIAYPGTGIRLVQAALIAVATACVGLAVLVASTTRCAGAAYYRRHYTVLAAGLLLVVLWAAFAGARTLLALDNPVRDSPITLYLLGYAPLMAAGAVFIVFKAPLYFNFELTAQWGFGH
ncbi:hypothetical protein H4R19_000877 [Coemansia spiralis]|nr:hypothetical protein H4R19_000877 [Coemansia spiralis]